MRQLRVLGEPTLKLDEDRVKLVVVIDEPKEWSDGSAGRIVRHGCRGLHTIGWTAGWLTGWAAPTAAPSTETADDETHIGNVVISVTFCFLVFIYVTASLTPSQRLVLFDVT